MALFGLNGQELKKLEGDWTKVSADTALEGKKIVAFYFSAHWCPPCKQFTPILRDFYQEVEDQGVEIIFVSSDRNASEMAGYMRESHGPWLAVPHGNPAIARMNQEYGVEGIPCLIVLTRQGDLVTKQGRQDVTSLAPSKCLQKWKK